MIKPPTIKAAVIGHPIAHSLSPHIHGFWLAEHGVNGAYAAIDVAPDQLQHFLRTTLFEENFAGINVTVPHKETALSFIDEAVFTAELAGAVNTIVVRGRRLIGSNTDIVGFVENIDAHAPGFDFTTQKAVVLGAGGAARAVVIALTELRKCPEVLVVNRTVEKAEALCHLTKETEKRVRAIPWEQRSAVLQDTGLLVNTTTLGMVGQNPLEIDLKILPKTALVNDIVYNPLQTELLKSAAARGNTTIDGLGMLLHQAVPGFEAWFGKTPKVTKALRKHVLNALVERNACEA